MRKIVVTCVTLGLGISSYGQSTFYVDNDAAGDPAPGDPTISDPLEDGTADHPFDAIQEALDQAAAGDLILVLNGRYRGPGNQDLDFSGKDLTLRSLHGAEACELIADTPVWSRVFAFQNGETAAARVEGFRMTGVPVKPFNCGGALLCAGASPTFVDCTFISSRVESARSFDTCVGGGAAYLEDSDATFVNCEFIFNYISDTTELDQIVPNAPGGVLIRGGNPTFDACLFDENHSHFQGDGGLGGAVGVEGGHATFQYCTFDGNWSGSGKVLFVDDSNVPISGPGADGAAIGARNAILSILNCDFAGNFCGDGATAGRGNGVLGGRGGAVYLEDCTAWIQDTTFHDNRAGKGSHGSPAAIKSGDGGAGGALAMINSDVDLVNVVIAGNRSGFPGDVSPGPVPGDPGDGGGVFLDGQSTLTVINSTIANNRVPDPTPQTQTGGLAIGTAATLAIHNSIVRSNETVQIGGDGLLIASYCNVEGGVAGTGNMDADPLFFDQDGPDNKPRTGRDNDYHLRFGSPANDAGDNQVLPPAVVLDLDGGPRTTDDPNTPDSGPTGSPAVDLGAYETSNGYPLNCDAPRSETTDCDADGTPDGCVTQPDCNGDGIIDICEADCDADGFADTCELAAPRDGHALDFVDNAVLVSSGDPSTTTAVTIEAWLRPRDLSGTQTIVRKRPNNYWLQMDAGRLFFSYRGATVWTYTSDLHVPPSVWSHVALTHQFGTDVVHVYLNGAEVPGGSWDITPTGPPDTSTDQLYVGNDLQRNTRYRGVIDEVRIWNVERTPTELIDAALGLVPPNAPGLIAYLPLDEGTGDTTVEQTSGAPISVFGLYWAALNRCVPCRADLNGDGSVNLSDLATVLAQFGQTGPFLAGDLNDDANVDLADLSLILASFGEACD